MVNGRKLILLGISVITEWSQPGVAGYGRDARDRWAEDVIPLVVSIVHGVLGQSLALYVSDLSTWWRWRPENLKFKVIFELYIKFNARLGYMKPRVGLEGRSSWRFGWERVPPIP